MTKGL